MNQNFIQKTYVVTMIILLATVLGMQRERLWGIDIFRTSEQQDKAATYTIDDIKILFSDAEKYQEQNDSIYIYSNDKQLGWAINTSLLSDSIIGFASSVPMLLGFDNSNVVVGITLLKNYESSDFVQDLKDAGFMTNWNKLHLTEIQHKKVDAVSGATLTSTAIIKTINHSASVVAQQKSSAEPAKRDIMAILKPTLGYMLILLALLQFFFPKRFKKIRMVHQIMVIIILGFWMGTFLSLFSFSNWITHGIDLPAKLFVFVILVLSIVLPLFTSKSFYCAHLCPFGASQELAGKIRKKKIKLSPGIKQFLATLQEKVFAVIMLLLFTGVSFDLTNVEPFSAFLFGTASIPVIVLASIFLILSIFIPRPWCRYACPTGYLLNIIRKPNK